MKHGHSFLMAALVVVALAVALTLIATAGYDSLATDGIIYVDADATADNNGTSWEHAFTTLQPALEAAGTGTQIWVAEGIYTPTEEHGGTGDRYKSFQMKNGVEIYGGFAGTEGSVEERDWEAYPTILSGDLDGNDGEDFANNDENSYHVFYHPEEYIDLDSTAILDGFTISGGNANIEPFGGLHVLGGGMYNYGSSPMLTNCTVSGNSAGYGGGMYNLDGASPALTNCTFSGNSADYNGGGMYSGIFSSPTLTDCTFSGNLAEDNGGGIYNEENSSPTLTNCSFSGNSAFFGSGMCNHFSSPTMTDCSFVDNSGGSVGGGMYNWESSPVLTNCTFSGNSAGAYGGGMYNWSFSLPTLTNCTFLSNSAGHNGGGMRNDWNSSPTLTNCTFSGNSAGAYGGGMYNWESSPVLTNCILWGDTAQEVYNTDSTPEITYSNVQGGYAGDGNIDADPLFVDAANGDYHLQLDSPCIDVGDNDAPDLPEYDFEGDDRVLDGDGNVTRIVDMGVDEVAVEWSYLHVYLPVVLRGY